MNIKHTLRPMNRQLVVHGLFKVINILLFQIKYKGDCHFFCLALTGFCLYSLEKEKSLFAKIIELKFNFEDEVKEFYKEDIEVKYPTRVPWKIYKRKPSQKTIRYHAFRQKIRIKDSSAIFLFRKIVPETLEEIFKDKKSQKRLGSDFFVKKNLSRDFFMNFQRQKIAPEIFSRYFSGETLTQIFFDDLLSKKNVPKDFLMFFRKGTTLSKGMGETYK